jgi:hypothetical protein
MNYHRITMAEMRECIDYYKSAKMKFTYIVTNNSIYLDNKYVKYMASSSSIKRGDMNFIRGVKQHVVHRIKKGIIKPFRRHIVKINYTKINPEYDNGFYYDCVEVDINNAYWNAAQKLGIISDDIHAKGIEGKWLKKWDHVSEEEKKIRMKLTRLISIGSLSRNKKTYYFDGNETILIPDSKEEVLKNKREGYFVREVSWTIDKLLRDISLETDYYMYWVDAIFVPRKDVERVCEMIVAAGYEYKVKNVRFIEFDENQINILDDKELRPFTKK